MKSLPSEVIEYLEEMLVYDIETTNPVIKKHILNRMMSDARTIFNLFLSNPSKREDLSKNVSFILEGSSLIIYSDGMYTQKNFTITREGL